MTEPSFKLRPHHSAASSIHDKSGSQVVLFRQLGKGLEYLERHLVLLPEPYPGCVLFFTVAAQDQAASVFYVRGATLEAAWREGSTRVRQWAWARKQNAVELRIDWVQDIIALKAGDVEALTMDPGKSWALADAELEHAELLLQRLQSSAGETAKPLAPKPDRRPSSGSFALLLGLQGIYIEENENEVAVPRIEHLPRRLPEHSPAAYAPLHSMLNRLLHRQQAHGGWPEARELADHLGLTYALLQIQRHLHHPKLALALHRAIAYFEGRQLQLPGDGMHQSLALLVLARHARHLHPGDAGKVPGLEVGTLRCMERLAGNLLPALGTAQPGCMAWADLALNAFARCGIRADDSDALRTVQSAVCASSFQPASPIELQPPQTLAPPGQPWLAVAMAESALLDIDSPPWPEVALNRRITDLRQLLHAIGQRTVMPEHALYLPPPSRLQEPFFQEATQQQLADTRTSTHLLVTALAALDLLRKHAAPAQPASRELPAQHRHAERSSNSRSTSPYCPMPWDGETLARIMGGTWIHAPQQPAPTCSGLDISRQNHLPGAAVLVRRPGLSIGIPVAALQTLQASALISNSPHGLLHHGVPVLHVPGIDEGLLSLAKASRQRIKTPVIAATGCAGKTATLSMLRRCLQGTEDTRGDTLLAQNTALQMINWSDAAPCALVELPLTTLHSDLPLVRPDVLIITNLNQSSIQTQKRITEKQEQILHDQKKLSDIEKIIHSLSSGSTLIMEHGLGSIPLLVQAASKAGIHIVTFGPHVQAQVRELAFGNGKLQISIDTQDIEIGLQSDGYHMALNAQAVLATLKSLGKSPLEAQNPLARWQPLPGMGQPQRLPNGICLLDHSQSSHMVSMQAAFTQLQAHALHGSNRVIVLGGIQSCAKDLEASQLQLEPLIRAAQAKRVLLYGAALRQLGSALSDMPHVNWYDDLNQLVYLLLRTVHKGDTVLLAGRATTNLAIAANALREISLEQKKSRMGRPISAY